MTILTVIITWKGTSRPHEAAEGRPDEQQLRHTQCGPARFGTSGSVLIATF